MRRFFILFVAIFLFIGNSVTYADQLDEIHEICSTWSDDAGYIMGMRQDGVPMHEAIQLVRDVYRGESDLIRLGEYFVYTAYEVSISNNPDEVSRIISEFQSGVYERCRITLLDETN